MQRISLGVVIGCSLAQSVAHLHTKANPECGMLVEHAILLAALTAIGAREDQTRAQERVLSAAPVGAGPNFDCP
jgi:hypothetical protein